MSSAAVHGSDNGKTLLSGREVDQGNCLIFALLNERLAKIKYAFSELSVLVQYGLSALKHDRITDFPDLQGTVCKSKPAKNVLRLETLLLVKRRMKSPEYRCVSGNKTSVISEMRQSR